MRVNDLHRVPCICIDRAISNTNVILLYRMSAKTGYTLYNAVTLVNQHPINSFRRFVRGGSMFHSLVPRPANRIQKYV